MRTIVHKVVLVAVMAAMVSIARGAGKSPLYKICDAVVHDDYKTVQEMLDEDPSLATAQAHDDGTTPLHYVRSVKVATLLLDQGANLFAVDHENATPLRRVAHRFKETKLQNLELVHYLQSKGDSEADFFFAIAIGDTEKVKAFLSKDKTLATTAGDSKDLLADGATPLHLAATNGQLEIVKLLVENGANVNDRGSWHDTEALEKAAWAGHADVVTFLLDHGAKIDGVTETVTDSPLHNAASDGRVDVVKILIDRGAKVKPRVISDVKMSLKDPNLSPEDKSNFQSILDLLQPKQ